MKRLFILLSFSLVLFGLTSCGPKKNHVVVVGTDGFSSEVIETYPGLFPNVEAMMKDGAYTMRRRSVLPSSSAVNWASMMMGASPEIHGYTTWSSQKPDLPAREIGKYGRFPGIFGLIRESRPDAKLAYLYDWGGMKYLFDEGSESYQKQAKDSELIGHALEYWNKETPELLFIAFGEPDGAGHGQGWMTSEYVAKCKVIDDYLGKIRTAVAQSPAKDNTFVIFTSDHGGIGKNHGGKTMQEMEAPLIITGTKVKKNYEIKESVMIYDTASIIANIFGLKQPQVWISRPVLSIYEK